MASSDKVADCNHVNTPHLTLGLSFLGYSALVSLEKFPLLSQPVQYNLPAIQSCYHDLFHYLCTFHDRRKNYQSLPKWYLLLSGSAGTSCIAQRSLTPRDNSKSSPPSTHCWLAVSLHPHHLVRMQHSSCCLNLLRAITIKFFKCIFGGLWAPQANCHLVPLFSREARYISKTR